MQREFRGVVCAGLLALASACATGSGTRQGDVEVSDGWINTRVRTEIEQIADARDRVSVRTQNGVVYLSGTVDSVADIEKIEERATAVRGVREVKNDLRVIQ